MENGAKPQTLFLPMTIGSEFLWMEKSTKAIESTQKIIWCGMKQLQIIKQDTKLLHTTLQKLTGFSKISPSYSTLIPEIVRFGRDKISFPKEIWLGVMLQIINLAFYPGKIMLWCLLQMLSEASAKRFRVLTTKLQVLKILSLTWRKILTNVRQTTITRITQLRKFSENTMKATQEFNPSNLNSETKKT